MLAGRAALERFGDSLLWHGQPQEDPPPLVRKLAALLGSVGIARLTWSPDLTSEELGRFLSRLALVRARGRHRAWEDTERYVHLHVEGPDYQALMATPEVFRGLASSGEFWQSLLQRVLGETAAGLGAADLPLPPADWGDPEVLADELVEAFGPAARDGGPEAVRLVRRFARALGEAAPGDDGATLDRWTERLAVIGRALPPALRLRLVESTIDEPQGDLFDRAFGALVPQEAIELLGKTFSPDPLQIERLARVLQHLIPRRLDRMEAVPQLLESIRRSESPDDPLADNAWQEIQELLTGEAGDFMSDEYRKQLRRLAMRESARRQGEDEFTRLPGLLSDLDSSRTADESLGLQMELLRLASSPETFREATEGLCGLCTAAFAAGDSGRGLQLIRELTALAEGHEPMAGPAADLQRRLKTIAVSPVLKALLPLLAEPSAEDRGLSTSLVSWSPETAVPILIDALVAGEPAGARREIEALLRLAGPESSSESLRRLPGAASSAARTLLKLVAVDDSPATTRVLLGLLERDDPKLRREALRLLLRIDAPDARRAMLTLLDDPDEEIVQAVATHLGASGSPETTRELLCALERTILGGRRAATTLRAIAILGRMRAAEAVGPLGEVLARRLWFSRRVRDEVVAAAVGALRRIGGDEARRLVEHAAARGPAPTAALCRRHLARWGLR